MVGVSAVTAFEYGLGHGFGAEYGSAVTRPSQTLAGSSGISTGERIRWLRRASAIDRRREAELGVTIRALRRVSYRSSRRWRFWCSPTTSCAKPRSIAFSRAR